MKDLQTVEINYDNLQQITILFAQVFEDIYS